MGQANNDHPYSGCRRLVATGAVLHLAIALAEYISGRMGLARGFFDEQGLASFAVDSRQYFQRATELASILRSEGALAWWSGSDPLHIKLFSLSITVLEPVVGQNILAVEPLNLICYTLVLLLVFKLGSEVFSQRAAAWAAVVIAVWPTYLLHSPQVLKDQFYIPGLLGLSLICVRLLLRSMTWKVGLWAGLLGAILVSWLWLIKSDLWELSLLLVVTSLAFMVLRKLRERTLLVGNVVAVCLIICALLGAPRLFGKYSKPDPHPLLQVTGAGANQVITILGNPSAPVPPPSRSSSGLERLRQKIAWARFLYANYPGSGSTIDPQIRFESWSQVIRYLPRALEIALFTPFPNTWFESGAKVGRFGRMLSGFETLVIYLIYVLIAVGMWRRKLSLAAWYLFSISLASMLALSLVTANLGALYRLRYPFWMLLIILGVGAGMSLRKTGNANC
jgi:hypothetical protein